jgi:hypothetical protein
MSPKHGACVTLQVNVRWQILPTPTAARIVAIHLINIPETGAICWDSVAHHWKGHHHHHHHQQQQQQQQRQGGPSHAMLLCDCCKLDRINKM